MDSKKINLKILYDTMVSIKKRGNVEEWGNKKTVLKIVNNKVTVKGVK